MTGKKPRVAGVDVARALAVLIMIEAHAYDAWIAEPYRATGAYRLTRFLATLPLPGFLVLAGAALALSVLGAARSGVPAAAARRSLVRRGLEVLAIGYAVNVAYALVDGADGLDTAFRVDVLHVIGASITLVAFAGIRGRGVDDAIEPRRLLAASIAIGLATTLPSFALQPLGSLPLGPFRYAVALFVEVPQVTKMPIFPLTGWFCLGVAALFLVDRSRIRNGDDDFVAIAGASPAFLGGLFALSLLVAAGSSWAMAEVVARSTTPLTRAHPAILLNLVDLGARGLMLLSVGGALAVALPAAPRAWLVAIGQGSLVVYVVHLPFCYGRPGAALFRKLDMVEATLLILPLYALSIGAVLLRDRLRSMRSGGVDGRTETARAKSRS